MRQSAPSLGAVGTGTPRMRQRGARRQLELPAVTQLSRGCATLACRLCGKRPCHSGSRSRAARSLWEAPPSRTRKQVQPECRRIEASRLPPPGGLQSCRGPEWTTGPARVAA